MRTSGYLNTAVGQKLLWLIMPLIGNTVRGEPSGYCSKMCFQKNSPESKSLCSSNSPLSISPLCLEHLQCAASKSNANVNLLQTNANTGGKKTLCVRQGVRDYMENKHYKNCEILNKRGLNPEQLAWNKLFWRGNASFRAPRASIWSQGSKQLLSAIMMA